MMTLSNTNITMENPTLKDIANLPALDRDQLKSLWLELFDSLPSHYSNEFMVRKIAWRMQEIIYGGLSETTKTKIKKLQKASKSKGTRTKTKRKKNLPPAGTLLCREYGGQEHRVMILEEGFEYRHCKYRSLSEIATKITGTKWSGPRFFGLS